MTVKRLNVNLPAETYRQLKELADDSHRTMTDVIRTGLGLVKIALEEEKRHNSLAIVGPDGEPRKHILIPG